MNHSKVFVTQCGAAGGGETIIQIRPYFALNFKHKLDRYTNTGLYY